MLSRVPKTLSHLGSGRTSAAATFMSSKMSFRSSPSPHHHPNNFVPHVRNTSKGKKAAAEMLLFDPDKKLPNYAETTLTRRQLGRTIQMVKHEEQKEIQKQLAQMHEAMRKKILSGTVELSYKEIQRLCKVNDLGMKGTMNQLWSHLFTFFC